MADQNRTIFDDPKLPYILLAFGLAAFFVSIYHCLVLCWFRRGQGVSSQQQPPNSGPNGLYSLNIISVDSSVAQLIPAHKHQKGSEDGVCAVCLCEFEDGEELRTLPECLHSFHVPCIDMWLYSHPNCPVCRTHTVPSLHVSQRVPEPGPAPGEVEAPLDARTLPGFVLQTNRL